MAARLLLLSTFPSAHHRDVAAAAATVPIPLAGGRRRVDPAVPLRSHWPPAAWAPRSRGSLSCEAKRGGGAVAEDGGVERRRVLLQAALWGAEAAYILWLFLLPYAPGDPVWAIKPSTISDLVGLSLNFFFILPALNSAFRAIGRCKMFGMASKPQGVLQAGSDAEGVCRSLCSLRFACVPALYSFILYSGFMVLLVRKLCDVYTPTVANSLGAFAGSVVGVHLLEAPVLHPMAEGLFNFVIAWTLLFAPLLFTDRQRDRYKGSLDLLWGFQMFLTNTFLIPYMAIRLNEPDMDQSPKTSQLGSLMVRGAPVVGAIGGLVCVISTVWALFGRANGDFGGLVDRWQFVQSYVVSERLAYAFLWDIFLYTIFQPWLIGDNLQNVKKDATDFVNVLRFIPVVGLVAYLLFLDNVKDS